MTLDHPIHHIPAEATVTAYWMINGRNRGLVLHFTGDDAPRHLLYEEIAELQSGEE